jgi:putative transposase
LGQLARSFAPFHGAGSLVKFSLPATKKIRKSRARTSGKWHLDEVRVKIRGQIYWLWRAVDDKGIVLDILIQKRQNTKAAKGFMVKLLKKAGFAPRVIILLINSEVMVQP